jgi:molybdopterin-synthase adenylyltransferase
MDWSPAEHELVRYSRNILLPELGAAGQARLAAARVLVVGAGGIGSPLALYLAAAGVGTIGLADGDAVELSNLQRQVLHDGAAIGVNKAESGRARLLALNDAIRVVAHPHRVTDANVAALLGQYDLVCDGTDDAATRFLLADASVRARRTLVSAAALRFSLQVGVFRPHAGGPCLRCLHPEPPPAGLLPVCAEAGILGAVTGVAGAVAAGEAIKEIAGIGETLAGRLLLWDMLETQVRVIAVARDPDCPVCGAPAPTPDPGARPA